MNDPAIAINVSTRYLANHPLDEPDKYPFAYQITIVNNSNETVQLINRCWLITDGNGKTSEVQGSGVVGKQPTLAPGEDFQYSSGAIIDTPVGSMQGFYEMKKADGSMFKVNINVFRLAVPHAVN
ncbi:Co2+/Mg2+ efflux protein ApaG [Alteromonas pelagimontana]|uniref:Co2+/Mg2+ efflux protein ApaG n=1 Tax=Alteromonas pelagimontana TaxID=1858656 RepID=A0A6M4MB70_9ALTE|nr:Co2+/Mg2+ efflux protein ApaG [Alteromonas pelagimontana]QJR80277.1 Co2+/Mg2+ efflux protein ApaG [Alteromonas pelagimontana]